MSPAIGQIIYYTKGVEQFPAIVTALRQDGSVCLHVFGAVPTGAFDMDNVIFSELYADGKWTWPKEAVE